MFIVLLKFSEKKAKPVNICRAITNGLNVVLTMGCS